MFENRGENGNCHLKHPVILYLCLISYFWKPFDHIPFPGIYYEPEEASQEKESPGLVLRKIRILLISLYKVLPNQGPPVNGPDLLVAELSSLKISLFGFQF